MNKKNIFVYLLICLFVRPLCAMQKLDFEDKDKVESIHFVNGDNIVVSVLERPFNAGLDAFDANSKKRKYLLVEKNKEEEQTVTLLYEEKKYGRNDGIGNYAINRQGTKIAFIDDRCLSVYDIQDKKEIWHKEVQCSDQVLRMTFNPTDDEEIIFYDRGYCFLGVHSRQESRGRIFSAYEIPARQASCIFHPTKAEFIVGFNAFYYYHGDSQNLSCKAHISCKAHSLDYFDQDAVIEYERYSHDGSVISMMASSVGGNKIVCRNNKNGTYLECALPTQRSRTCTELLLHPNNRVVFLLNDMSLRHTFGGCYLYSYDMQTGTLICSWKLDDDQAPYDVQPTNRRIAVSADGKKIGIALNKKCVLLSTLYMLLGKEGVDELFQKKHWLTRHFQEQNEENGFPLDVMDVIIEKLLDVHYA